LGKAMVFGSNMQNFAEIAGNLVAQKGALQVRNAAELETALEQLLSDEKLRAELGHNALKVVRANLGGIDRTIEMIVQQLDKAGELYITERN
jgi:3-deoxy-D-manno-octulosonic-acid transferase